MLTSIIVRSPRLTCKWYDINMHNVNPKRRRAAALRFLAYCVILTLSVLTTVLLLYIAQGYRYRSGHVIRSGLLLVNSKPEAGAVYINEILRDSAVPSRFVLEAGSYNMRIERLGYNSWSKKIFITASGVEEVNYPWLIPTNLTTRSLMNINKPALISQSIDRQWLLLQATDDQALYLIKLDPKSPKINKLTLPMQIVREHGSAGSFKVIEWALNNRNVLLEQHLPSGKKQLISLDVAKPDEAINISQLYNGQNLTQIHYKGNDTNTIYGLKGSALSLYSLKQPRSNLILKNITAYQPYGNDMVEFARVNNGTKQIESGLWLDDKATPLHSEPIHSGRNLLAYDVYDDHNYFAVAQTEGVVVTVYRDGLKQPVLAKQLPFTTIEFDRPQKLQLSGSGQFLLMQNKERAAVYDFEHHKTYRLDLKAKYQTDVPLKWVDDSHLIGLGLDGKSYLMDYDFTNQQALIASLDSKQLYFANNFQHVYRVKISAKNAQIEVTSLVNGKP